LAADVRIRQEETEVNGSRSLILITLGSQSGPPPKFSVSALHHIQKNIGYLPHTIEHFWHGPKPKRRYIERWDIIIKHEFDPFEDLKRNVFGVLELAGNKPDLTRDIDIYFLMRDEDSNERDYFSS